MSEVEEAFMRIKTHKGVKGIFITNYSGVAVKSTMSASDTHRYGTLLATLTQTARSTIRELDSQNDLVFLRVKSRKHEILIAPDREYLLVVVQNSDDD